jgi:hypothetical protein
MPARPIRPRTHSTSALVIIRVPTVLGTSRKRSERWGNVAARRRAAGHRGFGKELAQTGWRALTKAASQDRHAGVVMVIPNISMRTTVRRQRARHAERERRRKAIMRTAAI